MTPIENTEVIINISNSIKLFKTVHKNALQSNKIVLLNQSILNDMKTISIQSTTSNEIQVIVLETPSTQPFVDKLIQLGASVYLLKNNTTEALEKIIQESHGKRFNTKSKLTEHNSIKEQLSNRELEVLQLICEQYKTSEIAKKLYISPRTVDCHRNKLLLKLNCRNTAGLVVYALQNQLVNIRIPFFTIK